MRFESQTFWIAKDIDSPDQYQDAFDLDARRGLAAIADGVTSAIFSGPWARLLTQATVAQPPSPENADDLQAWLAPLRAQWLAGIDVSRLTWFQRPKMIDGGMTTLLWVELTPFTGSCQCEASRHDPSQIDVTPTRENKNSELCRAELDELSEGFKTTSAEEPLSTGNCTEEIDASRDADNRVLNNYRMRSYAIGDCCLFHVRGNQLITMFPLDNSAAFGLNPAVIGSKDAQADHSMQFQMIESQCQTGDLLVLCTDALALWAVNRWELGEPVDWERYWDMPAQAWRDEVLALRRDNAMRYDDSTLILLRIIDERPAETITDDRDPGVLKVEVDPKNWTT